MSATICEYLASIGQVLWAFAEALVMAAALLAAIGLWAGIIYGLGRGFRNWRLYSRHPFAKRIRTFLRQRRAARAAA